MRVHVGLQSLVSSRVVVVPVVFWESCEQMAVARLNSVRGDILTGWKAPFRIVLVHTEKWVVSDQQGGLWVPHANSRCFSAIAGNILVRSCIWN